MLGTKQNPICTHCHYTYTLSRIRQKYPVGGYKAQRLVMSVMTSVWDKYRTLRRRFNATEGSWSRSSQDRLVQCDAEQSDVV